MADPKGFLSTSRTGIGVSHRVAMLLSAQATAPGPGWATGSPRADADPVLNAWAGRLLGPADPVSARGEELDDTGAVTTTHVVSLPSLGLAPADLVEIGDYDLGIQGRFDTPVASTPEPQNFMRASE